MSAESITTMYVLGYSSAFHSPGNSSDLMLQGKKLSGGWLVLELNEGFTEQTLLKHHDLTRRQLCKL